MDLNDFITTTLKQIVQGVVGAQDAISKLNGAVNPAISSYNPQAQSHFGTIEPARPVFLVEFDVAISVVEGGERNAAGKLQVASVLSLGGGAQSSHSSSSTNRLSFKVPLALPVDTVTANRLKVDVAEARERTTRSLDYPHLQGDSAAPRRHP